MSNLPIRVLVAEDHAVVRNGIVGIVNAQEDMTVVAEAQNGEEAVAKFLSSVPDIALIDLQMPRLDGAGAVEAIRLKLPDARLIILTTYETDDDIERALKAGAKGYLTKDIDPLTLVKCMRDVLGGKTSVAPNVAEKLASRYTRVQLTTRELEVLKLIAKGLTNKQIGIQLFIAESTVKLHVNSLFEKLEVTSRTEAMKVGLERGLIRLT
jgi:DNA-binding NarL/FixJ family response regulator